MRTPERLARLARQPDGRLRLGFDRLESRLALSGFAANFPSGSTSTLMISGDLNFSSHLNNGFSSLVQSPRELSVSLGRAIDGFSVGIADFSLVHVANNGSTSPLMASEARIQESIDPSDPSSSRIALQLSRPLVPGRYELILDGQNQLQGTDGTLLDPSGTDLEVATFSIQSGSTGLSSAVDLGLASDSVQVATDSIDLATNSGAVKLYKLTLAPGSHWRLGVSVTSEGNSAAFDSTLSLFDGKGHLVATQNGGQDGTPGDSYLFAGVEPGTYYVGVSSEGNIPGEAGGYDPALGTVGVSGQFQPGGTFELSYVADPVTRPTQVVGLKVDQADPNSTVPTGLTAQFSGSIQESTLRGDSQPTLVAVDSSGRSWPVTISSYDESLARLSVVFNQPLPAGQYSLRIQSGTLVDLAGLVPVKSGRPLGTLGSFTVGTGTQAPNDLGSLLPGVASTGLSSPVVVAPGGSTVENFEVIEPGLYSILGADSTTGLQATLSGSAGQSVVLPSTGNSTAGFQVILQPGTYSLSLANPGPLELSSLLTVRQRQSSNDSLLVGGISQGPALNLRLIAPSTFEENSASNRSSTLLDPQPMGSTGFETALKSLRSDQVVFGGGGSSPAIGSGLTSGILYLNISEPLGRPSPTNDQMSLVGPSVSLGSVALGSYLQGPSNGVASSSRLFKRASMETKLQAPTVVPVEVADTPNPSILNFDFGLISGASTTGVDDKILEDSGWFEEVVSLTLQPLEPIAEIVASTNPDVKNTLKLVVDPSQAAQEARVEEEPQVELASMVPSLGFGLVITLAYVYRGRVLTRPGSHAGPLTSPKHRPKYAGPHQRIRVLR